MRNSVGLWSFLPISIACIGMDMVSGWPVLHTYILPFLSQNGF